MSKQIPEAAFPVQFDFVGPGTDPLTGKEVPANHTERHLWLGISVRDYFAAKALQGLIANKANPLHFKPEDDAAYCYTIADAMLAARSTP